MSDDAYGGYRGMWRSAEDELKAARGHLTESRQRVKHLERLLRAALDDAHFYDKGLADEIRDIFDSTP